MVETEVCHPENQVGTMQDPFAPRCVSQQFQLISEGVVSVPTVYLDST
ncbi:hypothetical protein RU98_GL001898 [Enterococcus caccae]|nr:hypothetical protein RU98_GL001898 [Enterococcus caccae]